MLILLLDIDDCSPNPCQNSGTCDDLVNDYNCTCVVGYTGKSCETSRLCIIIVALSIHLRLFF